jgi:hypothetical protein
MNAEEGSDEIMDTEDDGTNGTWTLGSKRPRRNL